MKPLMALVIACIFAGPAGVTAHTGHEHKTMGTVSMIHESHLEVKDTAGKATTFTLDRSTRIRRGKAAVALTDIKVGDRIVVTTRETKDKSGKAVIVVLQVQLGTGTSSSTGGR